MIIEFTGAPCSGKSFIIGKLEKKNDFSFKLVNKSKYDVFFNLFLIYKYLHLLLVGKAHLFIIRWVLFSKNNFFIKLRLIYNVIKKLVLYWTYENKDGIYIFDEGISHVVFNVLIDQTLDPLDFEKFLILHKKLPFVNLTILVEADKKTISERIKKRGHRRLLITPAFIDKNLEIQKTLINYHKNSKNFLKISNSQNIINLEIQKLTELLKQRISNV